jgi:hypothetical protein
MLWGQDETAVSQNSSPAKEWVDSDGSRPLKQKSAGETIMISALISREMGFDPVLSPDDLQRVNNFRRGSLYADQAAAIEVSEKNTAAKGSLEKSPFVQEIIVGVNNDGYWGYSQMVVQLEDVFDCCQIVWPAFEHIFLFDSSSGHKKKRIEGLDALSMNVGFGGSQPKMRETTIEATDGYLGPYERQLSEGDCQSLEFKEDDQGPFYLSSQDQIERRNDRPKPGAAAKLRNKHELYRALVASGVTDLPKHVNKIARPELEA